MGISYEDYENERWVPISGFDHYEISDYGRVWSIIAQRCLKNWERDGYDYISLYRNGKSYNMRINRLVASAFYTQRQKAIWVNHNDGDKKDNYFENLEWVTPGENEQHAYDSGLKIPCRKAVRIIETDEVFESLTVCAQTIGGCIGNIVKCISGERKTHCGYTFEYVE